MNGYVNGLPLNSAVSRGRYAERKVHRRPAQGVTALMDPARLAILVACFLATFVAYVERVGFSIAYTVMAKEAAVSDAVKGTVLSAFFWGYGLSQARLCAALRCAATAERHRSGAHVMPQRSRARPSQRIALQPRQSPRLS